MNIENYIAIKIYQLLLSIRDSAEYALFDVESKPHIFYLRKSLIEGVLDQGPFVDMLKANKESGQRVYNNLYKMYRDIYVDCKYLKVEDDKITRFDGENQEILEQLIANYYVVYEILEYNLNIFENVHEDIKKLFESSHQHFIALYSYVLIVNILQEKNLALISKNEQNYTAMVTLFYFFKDRAKTKDEELNDILEDIERIIVMFSLDNKEEEAVSLISKLYVKLDKAIEKKEKRWQEDYSKILALLKGDYYGN